MLATGLHVPPTCRSRCKAPPAKARRFGLAAGDSDTFLQNLFTTDDTATVIIFMHPEMMNFDTGTFEYVYNGITQSGLADELTQSIKTCCKAWSTRVQLTDANGQPIYDSNNQPYYLDGIFRRHARRRKGAGADDPAEHQGHARVCRPQLDAAAGLSFIASSPLSARAPRRKAMPAGETAGPWTWSIYNQSTASGLSINSVSNNSDGESLDDRDRVPEQLFAAPVGFRAVLRSKGQSDRAQPAHVPAG